MCIMAIKKIGRLWRTRKAESNVVMSGELIDGARIGVIRAKDKKNQLIKDTYDIIAFIETNKEKKQKVEKKEEIQYEKF